MHSKDSSQSVQTARNPSAHFTFTEFVRSQIQDLAAFIEAGGEVGRHDIMTHAYWREGGPDFHNVNVMGVAHGTDKEMVLEHKGAIDQHLDSVGIPVSYTNVFWGGRSEIKPSEISPIAYREWCQKVGIDPETMRED